MLPVYWGVSDSVPARYVLHIIFTFYSSVQAFCMTLFATWPFDSIKNNDVESFLIQCIDIKHNIFLARFHYFCTKTNEWQCLLDDPFTASERYDEQLNWWIYILLTNGNRSEEAYNKTVIEFVLWCMHSFIHGMILCS